MVSSPDTMTIDKTKQFAELSEAKLTFPFFLGQYKFSIVFIVLGKWAPENWEMDSHVLLRTCNICVQIFQNQTEYLEHRNLVHSKNSKERSSVCKECDRTFTHKYYLQRHTQLVQYTLRIFVKENVINVKKQWKTAINSQFTNVRSIQRRSFPANTALWNFLLCILKKGTKDFIWIWEILRVKNALTKEIRIKVLEFTKSKNTTVISNPTNAHCVQWHFPELRLCISTKQLTRMWPGLQKTLSVLYVGKGF